MDYSEMISEITVIGLTGQSGAGKTTVSNTFVENGFSVINADIVARDVVKPDYPCLNDIIKAFGHEYLLADGNLNRRKLGNTVFSDKSKLDLLNSITYPYITDEILNISYKYSLKGKKVVIIDAPTLFESGINKYCKKIISVISDKNVRIKRIVDRDNITEREALERINSQYSDDFYVKQSDYVIYNDDNDTLDDLKLKAKNISKAIRLEYGI